MSVPSFQIRYFTSGRDVVVKNNGEAVEEGDAVRDEYNATLWRYTTQKEKGVPGTTIEAFAVDIPVNVTGGEVEL